MSTLRAGWGVTMPSRSCGRPRHCRSSPIKEGAVSGSAASFAKGPLGVRTLGGPSFLSGSPEQERRAGRQRSVVDAAVVAVENDHKCTRSFKQRFHLTLLVKHLPNTKQSQSSLVR